MKRTLWALLATALALPGCVTRPQPIERTEASYTLGEETRAAVGMAFVRIDQITTGYTKHYRGWVWGFGPIALFFPTYVPGQDSIVRRELVYTGRAGDTILVAYREGPVNQRRASAQKPVARDLRYDLSRSPVMVFQKLRMRIVEATNEEIRVVVLSDGGESPGLEPGAP
jgi:hypothetical protein